VEKSSILYNTYVSIMRRELVPAMGCTEPIAVAFCAAKARQALGEMPQSIHIQASGNIIKNVKSVIVPHTGGLRGLEAAAAVGAFYGNADIGLEVVSAVTEAQVSTLSDRMKEVDIKVSPLVSEHILDLLITVRKGDRSVSVHIEDEHTNITEIVENGVCTYRGAHNAAEAEEEPDYGALNVADIFDFANSVDVNDVSEILERQIAYNTAISKEGLKNNYGARIGQLLLKRDNNVRTRAKAYAAAGSDARMSGCDMPVIINSGSGNQGMTASLPVIAYAEHYGKSREELLRALALSNLITLHLKSGIGRLSAYCGAVSAGAGAGAGIAYLSGGDERDIAHTIVNTLAITSGIVCDGAKSSCAAKIATAVETGIFGYDMYRNGQQFYAGDGLVVKGVENSIANFGRLARIGMRDTDREIILMMTEEAAH
jgi:L-cysteine desulfidase